MKGWRSVIYKNKAIKLAAAVLLGALLLFLMLCPMLRIHIFTFGLKSGYVSRVDCISGYYVAVYENDVCYYQKDGEDCLTFGNVDNISEFDWKHSELLGVVPYRRFLCFSKKTEEEIYFLTDATGTVRYGMMYVLRTPGKELHYYYRRDYLDSTLNFSPLLYQEKITFSCDETDYELKDFYRFTANIDFTTGEHLLQIEGEPCYFKALAQ